MGQGDAIGVTSGQVVICISIKSLHPMSLLFFFKLGSQIFEASHVGLTLLFLKSLHH